MSVTIRIVSIPDVDTNGALYFEEVVSNHVSLPDDPLDKNDFKLRFIFSEDVSLFTNPYVTISVIDSNEMDISDQFSIQRPLHGKNAVYEMVVRPHKTAGSGTITIKVLTNAISQGNTEVIQTFPYTDVPQLIPWTLHFETDDLYDDISDVSHNRVRLLREGIIDNFNFDGSIVEDESQNLGNNELSRIIPYKRHTYFGLSEDFESVRVYESDGSRSWESGEIWTLAGPDEESGSKTRNRIRDYAIANNGQLIVVSDPYTFEMTRAGPRFGSVPTDLLYRAYAAGETLAEYLESTEYAITSISIDGTDAHNSISEDTPIRIATYSDRIYFCPEDNVTVTSPYNFIVVSTYDYQLRREWKIPFSPNTFDGVKAIFVRGPQMYVYDENNRLWSANIESCNHTEIPSTIPPIEVKPGDTIDTTEFTRSVTKLIPSIGFSKPDWMTIGIDGVILISPDAPLGATALVKISAINDRSSLVTECSFYVYVSSSVIPKWAKIRRLNMYSNQVLNMFDYCEDADEILWQPGFVPEEGITLERGRIWITGDNYPDETTLRIRAQTRNFRRQDIEFKLGIIPANTGEIFDEEEFEYQVLIEGEDVTPNLVQEGTPKISSSLDVIRINNFVRGRCEIALNNNEAYFDSDASDNFWSEYNLNKNGYLNRIEIYAKNTEADSRLQLFEGTIIDWNLSIEGHEVKLGCIDTSYFTLQSGLVDSGFGTSEIVHMKPQVDQNTLNEPVNEGSYEVEDGLSPLNYGLPVEVKAYSHQSQIVIKDVANKSEGNAPENYLSGFLTPASLQVSGGYLENDILLRYKTLPKNLDAVSAISKMAAVGKDVFTVHSDLEEQILPESYFSTNGSIPFSANPGRVQRYPVSWVHDEVNEILYVLLSSGVNYITDQIIEHNLFTKSYRIVHEFNPRDIVFDFTTKDYHTFYVLSSPSGRTNIYNTTETPQNNLAQVELDSADLQAKSKILIIVPSENSESVYISSGNTYRPQIGSHYWVGSVSYQALVEGIQPNLKAGFNDTPDGLYYRYSNNDSFGIGRSNNTNTVLALFSEAHDTYYSHLNFDFDIDTEGNTYFGYCKNTITHTQLVIKKHNGTAEETLFDKTINVGNIPEIDDGERWLGVHELLFHDGYLYLIVPVSRDDLSEKSAASIVYRFSIDSKELRFIDKHDFLHWGANSLTIHNDSVYFAEGTSLSYKFPAVNRDLESFDEELQQNKLIDDKGTLKEIMNDRSVIHHGNIWFEQQVFRSCLTKMLSFDDALHLISHYGDIDSIQEYNSAVSNPDNLQWITWGRKLKYNLPTLPSGGSIYEIFVQIAAVLNVTFSVERNIVVLKNREPIGALLLGDIDNTQTTIPFHSENKEIPISSYVLIANEVVQYTGYMNDSLMNVVRGVGKTLPTAHTGNSIITFLDRIIESNRPVEDLMKVTTSSDSNHVYNIIETKNLVRIQEKDSIGTFSQRPLELGLLLNQHNISWIEYLAERYLSRFKDLKQLAQIEMRPNFHISLGEIIHFRYAHYSYAAQIMQINHSRESTQLVCREVKPLVTSTLPDVVIDPNETYRVLDGVGDTFFCDGAGDCIIWTGNELYQHDRLLTFPEGTFLANVSAQQYVEMNPIQLPSAKSLIGSTVTHTLTGLTIPGLEFDSINLQIIGIPQSSGIATVIYTAMDDEGTIVTHTFQIIVGTSVIDYNRRTDGTGDPFFFDGNGDLVIWEG